MSDYITDDNFDDLTEIINRTLDLPLKGQINGYSYVITMDNSDEFSWISSYLSTEPRVELDSESITTGRNCVYIYHTDELDLRLTGDFEKDVYRLFITRR